MGSQYEALLSANSMTEFSDRLEFLGAITQTDSDLAAQADEAAQRAAWATQEYDHAVSDAQAKADAMNAQRDQAQTNLNEQAQLANQLESQYAAAVAAQQAALDAQQNQTTSTAPVTTPPPSGGGSDGGGGFVPTRTAARATAIAAAQSVLGAPYVFGAAGPDAFDCSGLTSWAWAQAGRLPAALGLGAVLVACRTCRWTRSSPATSSTTATSAPTSPCTSAAAASSTRVTPAPAARSSRTRCTATTARGPPCGRARPASPLLGSLSACSLRVPPPPISPCSSVSAPATRPPSWTWSSALTPSMRRVARMFVSTDAVADEVVQDAWVGVLRGIDAFEGRSSLRTWIFRILVNTAKTRGQRESPERPVRDARRRRPRRADVGSERRSTTERALVEPAVRLARVCPRSV